MPLNQNNAPLSKREQECAQRMAELMQVAEVQEFAWLVVEIRRMTRERALQNAANDLGPEAA